MNNTQIDKAILDEDLYALDTLLKDRSGCFSYIRFALQNGKVKSFLYLYERGHADGFYTIELFDNFALLQAAVEGGYRMDRDEFSCSTVIRKFPTLEVLQFCHQHSFHHWGHISIANAAAASGNVEMLRYCFNNGCQVTSADDAIVREDLVYEIEDIQYENIVSEAAMSGNLDCLKYAIYLGGAINWVALCKAAEKGHKHIIKYLLSIGCGVDNMCTSSAAFGNHLDCLKLLVTRGRCPLGINVLYYAAKHNNTKMFTWAVKNGCSLEEDTDGVQSGDIVKFFAEHGNWLYVRKSIRLGLEVDANTMEYTIDCDNVAMLKFCYDHYKFGRLRKVQDLDVVLSEHAAQKASFKCLKFIFKNKFNIRLRRVFHILNNTYADMIDLEDVWYRHLFFNRVPERLLSEFPNLQSMVEAKREYYNQVKVAVSQDTTICEDVATNIVNKYIE